MSEHEGLQVLDETDEEHATITSAGQSAGPCRGSHGRLDSAIEPFCRPDLLEGVECCDARALQRQGAKVCDLWQDEAVCA